MSPPDSFTQFFEPQAKDRECDAWIVGDLPSVSVELPTICKKSVPIAPDHDAYVGLDSGMLPDDFLCHKQEPDAEGDWFGKERFPDGDFFDPPKPPVPEVEAVWFDDMFLPVELF